MSDDCHSALSQPTEITLLDCSIERERAAFEKGFYAAFSLVTSNYLIRDLWIWDHDRQRLRTRIPYGEQRILALRNRQGAIDMAMAINFSQTLRQAAWFGFSTPSEPGESCEILAYYSTGQNKLASMRDFLITCSRYGEREGRIWADATCTERLLKVYRQMGSRLLASRTINGEVRHQIRMDIRVVSGKPSSLTLSL